MNLDAPAFVPRTVKQPRALKPRHAPTNVLVLDESEVSLNIPIRWAHSPCLTLAHEIDHEKVKMAQHRGTLDPLDSVVLRFIIRFLRARRKLAPPARAALEASPILAPRVAATAEMAVTKVKQKAKPSAHFRLPF